MKEFAWRVNEVADGSEGVDDGDVCGGYFVAIADAA